MKFVPLLCAVSLLKRVLCPSWAGNVSLPSFRKEICFDKVVGGFVGPYLPCLIINPSGERWSKSIKDC